MKTDNPKNIYFDFCETLVDFQTADAFVDFVRRNSRSKYMVFMDLLYILLKKIKLFSLIEKWLTEKSVEKKIKLYQLKGIPYSYLDDQAERFYNELIKNRLIKELFQVFVEHYNLNEKITVISGGYEIYLKYFIKDFPKCSLISTQLEYKNGCSTGKIKGNDCLYAEKIKRLEQSNASNVNSIAYSDSSSDLPLLTWAESGYVVSKNKPQSWAKINQLNEIIWNQ